MYLFQGSHKKDYSILGFIWGCPYFGKLPYVAWADAWDSTVPQEGMFWFNVSVAGRVLDSHAFLENWTHARCVVSVSMGPIAVPHHGELAALHPGS